MTSRPTNEATLSRPRPRNDGGRRPTMQSIVRVTFLLLLAGTVVGCGTATAIPSGAQTVSVVATDTQVRVDPSTVHAGDVFLVLDVPQRGVVLVSRGGSDARGSLTHDDLARLTQNADTQGVTAESLTVSCCGNVYKETFPAGRYAFMLRDPSAAVGRPPESLAILDVSP